MKKVSIRAAFFTGIFVALIALLSDILLPDGSNIIIAIIVGLSAMLGGLIGNNLFPKE